MGYIITSQIELKMKEVKVKKIAAKDKARLRSLAYKQLEFANCQNNENILKKWQAQAQMKRETPTVRLLFSNFPQEVVYNRLECEGAKARKIEEVFLNSLVGRELFDDDTPVADYFSVEMISSINPFGLQPCLTHQGSHEHSNGYHIESLIEELDESLERLKGGGFSVDIEGTKAHMAYAEDIFGDIMPVKMVMKSLPGAITNPLVHLMGMENYYISMLDTPDTLHKVMDMATCVYENYYNYLEEKKLLLPTNGMAGLAQESFSFTNELPKDTAIKTTDCWGFLESQEATAVSPQSFGEFVFPYQDRLAKRFGLLSYGCCERVDAIYEQYLSRCKNLRKLSVSPFNNEAQIGEFLRGSNIVYYSKPRAEQVTMSGPMNEGAIRENFKMVCTAASGCLFEVAQREGGTIYGDYSRGKRYVQILRECIEDYWKP